MSSSTFVSLSKVLNCDRLKKRKAEMQQRIEEKKAKMNDAQTREEWLKRKEHHKRIRENLEKKDDQLDEFDTCENEGQLNDGGNLWRSGSTYQLEAVSSPENGGDHLVKSKGRPISPSLVQGVVKGVLYGS